MECNLELSLVENEVHVYEWMKLFISGCLGNILY